MPDRPVAVRLTIAVDAENRLHCAVTCQCMTIQSSAVGAFCCAFDSELRSPKSPALYPVERCTLCLDAEMEARDG